MPCNTKSQYEQLAQNESATAGLNRTADALESALRTTTDQRAREGLLSAISQIRGASNILSGLRPRLLRGIGVKFPRPTIPVLKLLGLSPGTLQVWHDAESGWFTEARETAGAPPVYRHVSDAVAMAILSGKLTHELEATLMAPDEYLGE